MSVTDLAVALGRLYHQQSPIDWVKWRLAAALDRLAPRTQGSRTARVAGGLTMDLDPSDFVQRTIYLTGQYEPHICQILDQHLRPGGVFLDVGANVGYLSLYAATLVGSVGQVYAFEPNASVHSALVRNIARNGLTQIRTFETGLSDAHGRASLHLTPNNLGAASLRPDAGPKVVIELDTYDRVAASNSLRPPTVMKIDVEGAEVMALRGMADLLSSPKRPRVILCEISEWSLKKLGSSRDELYSLLAAHGYAPPSIISPVRRSNRSAGDAQYDAMFLAMPAR